MKRGKIVIAKYLMMKGWLTPCCFRKFCDAAYHLRFVCCDRHACLLRIGSAKPVVHSGVCGVVRARLDLRLSARRMAVWVGGGSLVGGGNTALVYGALSEQLIAWHRLAADFFQHLGIDIASANDGSGKLFLRQLTGMKNKSGHSHGAARLSHGRSIRT
jgi:hypothetical protein